MCAPACRRNCACGSAPLALAADVGVAERKATGGGGVAALAGEWDRSTRLRTGATGNWLFDAIRTRPPVEPLALTCAGDTGGGLALTNRAASQPIACFDVGVIDLASTLSPPCVPCCVGVRDLAVPGVGVSGLLGDNGLSKFTEGPRSWLLDTILAKCSSSVPPPMLL